jgi:hypothetical protein
VYVRVSEQAQLPSALECCGVLLRSIISLGGYVGEQVYTRFSSSIARHVRYPTSRLRRPMTVLMRPKEMAIAVSEDTGRNTEC